MWLTNKIQPIWQKLQPAQRGYALATVCVGLWLLSFCSQQWLLYGMALALLCAVTQDMWQGFLRIWNSLAGKAVIVVFYAILGNFCFAMAESQVNNLIGIRTDVVPYTVNLTVLLLAPIWSFSLSLVVLTLYTILHTGKIMLLLLLRPIGIRSHHLLGDEAYPVKTLLARIVYLPVFMSCLAVLPSAYLTGDSSQLTNLFNGEPTLVPVKNNDDAISAADARSAANAAVTPQNTVASDDLTGSATTDSTATTATNTKVTASHNAKGSNQVEINLGSAIPTIPWLNRTLAGFLYQLESMGRSSCVMSGQEHLVHINDYEVLVITPDKKAESGYQYQVRLCGSVGYRQPASLPPEA
ncbi:hypothetical protein A5320_13955 [Rheinheimera sp. SA_1]|jgi:hypothetical protein|uniref:hypothetical protein n=1 Tax=Rheinheimera sp. SA_1 TaxID=1827365 RepID=UPI0007FD4347|nr:hypothetical protein [Rheinheimera sp. SA_1]OBP14817.1 hypothetical protein A5320_13955 [Rheinheimera sp. SA_1]